MIYLDHAATSYPKPSPVIKAQLLCMKEGGGNAGRGSHTLAMKAAERIFECREVAARFLGADSPEQVVFTPNTTVALNIAIKGLLHKGDHVLLSDMEHNSVFRPIYRMACEGTVTYDIFPTFPQKGNRTDEEIFRAICAAIRPNTKALVCAHASNICSSVLPIDKIGAICAQKGILFIVDAAQSAGSIPINMKEMGIDVLCVPGHKGLLGPQGTGMLLLRKGLVLDTLIEGGSGVDSMQGTMPTESPERYEAGTLPAPLISGLCEGIRCVERIGIERIFAHEQALNRYLQEQLLRQNRIRIYVPNHVGSVLLFGVRGIPADKVGALLNRHGICVRTGYHCTALGHKTLGTPNGGAIRVSTGFSNTREDIDALIEALAEIVRTLY